MISRLFTWAFCNLTSCFPAGVKVHTLSVLTDATTQAFRLWLNHPLQNEVKWQVCWGGCGDVRVCGGCVMGRVVRGLGHYVICAIKVWRVTLRLNQFCSRVRGDVQMVSVWYHWKWLWPSAFSSWFNISVNCLMRAGAPLFKLVLQSTNKLEACWLVSVPNQLQHRLISVPDYLLTSIQYMCMYK